MAEKLLLLAVFVVSMLLMAGNHRRKRKKIVFFGDSITQEGSRPGGFITRIIRLLKEADMEYNYELVNAGANGDKVHDLYQRMDTDILANGADIVVIVIGINDILFKNKENEIAEKNFETVYETIIKKLDQAAIKIVVCTLTAIDEKINDVNNYEEKIEIYSQIVRNLAVKYNLPLVDLRKAFLNYNLINDSANSETGILPYDNIHLNNDGNQLVAEEMWKVLQQIK